MAYPASQTFEQVWRTAHAEAPGVPALMTRGWAQEGYSKACDSWGWSFLRAENILTTQPSRTVTVNVVQGSTTVTGTGQFIPATDQGLQFRVNPVVTLGQLPLYTITVCPDTNTATLDMPFADPSANNVTATVVNAYTTLPPDFRRFLVIYDRYYLRVIPYWLSEDEIAIADPGRVFTDQGPRYLVARKYSTALNTLGQVQYELWPQPTSFRAYPYLYIRSADQLSDSAVLPGVFSQRSDIFKTYCLSRACAWPGTSDSKNPLFNLTAAAAYKTEWETELNKLEMVDDAEYPQQLMLINWQRRLGSIAPTATLLRQTDATMNDYF